MSTKLGVTENFVSSLYLLKKEFMEKLADEVEEAAQKQDMATLYKITKSLAGGFKNNDVPVKDLDGNVITGIVEQMQRWKNHFESVLNRDAPSIHVNIPENDINLDVDTNPPSLDEVKNAIRHLKSRKAPGTDCINAEMLKAANALTKIFKEIWETDVVPDVWKTALIAKLPKKGDRSLCNNWRGIALLSITSKVFTRVIFDRISAALDPLLRREQASFRKGKSSSDQMEW